MPEKIHQPPVNVTTSVDWKDILHTLSEQKCVLFLGSGAYQAPDGQSVETALCDWLDATNPDHPEIRVYNPDGFFLFKKPGSRRKVILNIKDFYNQQFTETEKQFERIARIPFSMIFSLNFDNILARTFDQSRFEYQSDFYCKHKKAPGQFKKPGKNKPLIYNLMGNVEEPDSLVLTHSDFFDYLNSVFTANNMNQDLRDEMAKAERYIFLGLPYEKWYFQVLLRILSLHDERLKEIERIALKEFDDPKLTEIYREEFKIEFIPVNTASFIEELHERCDKAGILKPVPLPDLTAVNQPILKPAEIRNLIANADVINALRAFKAYSNLLKPRNSQISNDFIVISNRFNLLKQREIHGTINQENYKIEWSQILESLLELIDKAENL